MSYPDIRLIKALGFGTYHTLLTMRDDVGRDLRNAIHQHKTVLSFNLKKGSIAYRGDVLKAARIVVQELSQLGYRAELYGQERIDVHWDEVGE